jgi:N-acetylglutamate synthase-like GNAT family acetyltransferase
MITYRPATPQDARAIALLFDMANFGSIAAENGRKAKPGQDWIDVTTPSITDNNSEISYLHTLIAEAETGDVAGMVIAFKMIEFFKKSSLHKIPAHLRSFRELIMQYPGQYLIRDIAVFPSYQGQRIASRLLNRVVERAVTAGVEKVAVIVHDTNEKQIAHYQKRGFIRVDSRPVRWHPVYAPDSQWNLLVCDADKGFMNQYEG